MPLFLQYQIKQYYGPCVKGLTSNEEYQHQVNYVRLFLSVQDQQVLKKLVSQMEEASRSLDLEKAACIRDQIQSVRHPTEKQFVSVDSRDLDIIAVAFEDSLSCVHILFIRYGKVLDSRRYFS